jgi:lactoylglutathione lyase
MKFGYAILYVDDVAATLEFYERAFGFPRRLLTDEKNYGELETGTTRLAFAARDFVRGMIPVEIAKSGPTSPAPPFELGMVTDDVDAAFQHALSCGATAVKQPEKKPWGQMVGYVRDLNGTLVEICSEMS